MLWLLLVSLLWAPSPGLVRHALAGVDPALVSFVRVTLALAVLAPLFRRRSLRPADALALGAIGAVQFGVMYVAYTTALTLIPAYEVAVLTIFTPLFVCIFEDLRAGRLHGWPIVAAAVATVGAGIIVMNRPFAAAEWKGVALVQLSNACFAAGQVAYRRWRRSRPGVNDARVFALLYLGAALVTLPVAAPALGTLVELGWSAWLTLAYLGVVASGLCFFLWNFGAARTATGPLAVMNDAKIPLMVACSLLVFGEETDLGRLLVGGALIFAAALCSTFAERNRGSLG